MKKVYEKWEIEIIELNTSDMLTTSPGPYEDDELPPIDWEE